MGSVNNSLPSIYLPFFLPPRDESAAREHRMGTAHHTCPGAVHGRGSRFYSVEAWPGLALIALGGAADPFPLPPVCVIITLEVFLFLMKRVHLTDAIAGGGVCVVIIRASN